MKSRILGGGILSTVSFISLSSLTNSLVNAFSGGVSPIYSRKQQAITSLTTKKAFTTVRRPHRSISHLQASTTSLLNDESTTIQTNQNNVKKNPKNSYDVIIVGSGIGGLSAAAMLSLYGYSVAVFEAHYAPGGCAHGYELNVKNKNKNGEADGNGKYMFDTGPSFFSGLNPTIPPKISNPLRTILDAIDEKVECIPYTTFGLKFPEGDFVHTTDFGKVGGALQQATTSSSSSAQSTAVEQWSQLMNKMKPLAKAVDAMPTAALRGDIGIALTASQFLPNFANTNPLENLKLTKPFSAIIDDALGKGKGNDESAFIRKWLDLLCFCLSGLPANGTITAEMAMMMGEFYEPDAIMDCPKGGAKSIVDALVRGLEKNGGSLFLNSPVEKIVIEDGRATGIQLRKKGSSSTDNDGDVRTIQATKAVISNLSVWDLFQSGIVDTNAFPSDYLREKKETPVGKSFMHMHIGFKATREELQQLEAHYMYMDDWERGVEAEDNAVLVSIPSAHDDTLAPPNHAVLHIYTPATEDYEKWANISRKSKEYRDLKEERSQYLWQVLEKIIPDIRDRTTVVQIGTPLTHKRFLRRYKGSYGPAIKAGEGSFPFPGTPVKGLLMCGDSCFPGIGVPAVAGSGILAANSVSLDSIKPQLQVLDMLKKQQQVLS